jgi:hypothetical protein
LLRCVRARAPGSISATSATLLQLHHARQCRARARQQRQIFEPTVSSLRAPVSRHQARCCAAAMERELAAAHATVARLQSELAAARASCDASAARADEAWAMLLAPVAPRQARAQHCRVRMRAMC